MGYYTRQYVKQYSNCGTGAMWIFAILLPIGLIMEAPWLLPIIVVVIVAVVWAKRRTNRLAAVAVTKHTDAVAAAKATNAARRAAAIAAEKQEHAVEVAAVMAKHDEAALLIARQVAMAERLVREEPGFAADDALARARVNADRLRESLADFKAKDARRVVTWIEVEE